MTGTDVRCVLDAPDCVEFAELYSTTGWGSPSGADVDRALAGSWLVAVARDGDGRAVGMARVISDGVLHAFVTEVVVHPERRGEGIGAMLVRLLVRECTERGVRDVQLFAATGRRAFYERLGFAARPADAPGMGLVHNS